MAGFSARQGQALTSDEECGVLNFDPWGERDATYRTLRSEFVRPRKASECAICFGPIAPGERSWAKTETDDGKVKTFRFCAECCWCIAHRNDEDDVDGGLAWERMDERWEIGRRRADAARLPDAGAPTEATAESGESAPADHAREEP